MISQCINEKMRRIIKRALMLGELKILGKIELSANRSEAESCSFSLGFYSVYQLWISLLRRDIWENSRLSLSLSLSILYHKLFQNSFTNSDGSKYIPFGTFSGVLPTALALPTHLLRK